MTITDELIAHVAGEPHERQQRFALHRAVFEGTMDAPLVNDDGSPNLLDNVILPALRKIVNSHARMLFGQAPTFDVTEAYGEEAQAYLLRLWRENRIPTRLLELGKHGGMTGQFGAKFEPDPTDARNGAHRFVVFDPSYLDVVWDPHDTATVLLYRFEYPTVDYADGKLVPFVWRQDIEAVRSEPDVYGRRRIESWKITNYRAKAPQTAGGAAGRWIGFTATRQISKWEQVGPKHPWPFTWSPVFAGQNLVSPNSWWGYSDIDACIRKLNHSLNRAASNIAKTIRHHGHPTTIAIGAELPEDGAIGEVIEIDGTKDEVDVYNLEMKSDLTAALEFLRELRAEVYDAGNLPDVARGKLDNLGQISGVALRILFGPQLEQNGEKRMTYGDELAARLRAALEYAKFTPIDGADADVALVWPDPLPRNEKEDAEVAEIDQRNGASQRTTLQRRGFDPDVEFDNRVEEGSNDPGMRGTMDLIDGGEPANVNDDAPDGDEDVAS